MKFHQLLLLLSFMFLTTGTQERALEAGVGIPGGGGTWTNMCWVQLVITRVCYYNAGQWHCSDTMHTETDCFNTWINDPCSPCTPPSGGPPQPPPGGVEPLDADENGLIDDWRSVVETSDPCADNFDLNDRLGSSFDGPNTARPAHTGVDIQADRGDDIFAWRGGTVAGINDVGDSCGNSVRIAHPDGSRTVYCHLLDSTVHAGDMIHAGELVGYVNSSGNSSGDHLHVSFFDANGDRQEFFWHVDDPPTGDELNAGGC